MFNRPNILNNVIANLRNKHFPGPFSRYAAAIGCESRVTYLKKIESGAISQPDYEALKALGIAYYSGEHPLQEGWYPVLDFLSEQISAKAFSADPPWDAIEALIDKLIREINVIPFRAIFCNESIDPLAKDLVDSTSERSSSLVSIEYAKRVAPDLLRYILLSDNISVFVESGLDASCLPSSPFSLCFDDAILIESHGRTHVVTASSKHIAKWNERFLLLQKKCLSLRERADLANTVREPDDFAYKH